MTSQWHMPKEDSKYFPSVQRGMSLYQELVTRIHVVSVLFAVGCRLELPLYAIGTASTLFHRFYARATFFDWDPIKIAQACLFIAAKIDESSRRASDIAKSWLYDPENPTLDHNMADKITDDILYYEYIVCEETCFDLQIDLPYYDLFHFTEQLQTPDNVVYTAYTFINDSFRLPLTLWYEPRQVAAAALYLAYTTLEEDFEYDSTTYFGTILEADHEIIKDIIATLMDIYKLPRQMTEPVANGQTNGYADHHSNGTNSSSHDDVEYNGTYDDIF